MTTRLSRAMSSPIARASTRWCSRISTPSSSTCPSCPGRARMLPACVRTQRKSRMVRRNCLPFASSLRDKERRPTAPRQTSRSSTARPCRIVFVIIAALAIVVTAPWRALREAEARTVVQSEPSSQIYCVFRARGRRYGFVLLPFLRRVYPLIFFFRNKMNYAN